MKIYRYQIPRKINSKFHKKGRRLQASGIKNLGKK
jgi:hypothetical protein